MGEPLLFCTAVPVLLGGSPKAVGRLAARFYGDHRVEPHWYGRGFHPLAALYTQKHPLSLPFSEQYDSVILRLLWDFEKKHRHLGGILCLIPCSPEAEAFVLRSREALEERYVLLERPPLSVDPLYGLVHSH